jgi:hypothetical protein
MLGEIDWLEEVSLSAWGHTSPLFRVRWRPQVKKITRSSADGKARIERLGSG